MHALIHTRNLRSLRRREANARRFRPIPTTHPAWALALGLAVSLGGGCSSAPKLGTGGSMIAGAAGGPGGQSTGALERCDAPLATIALVERDQDTNAQLLALLSPDLSVPASPIPLLRLLIQQSNCFRVVDRAGGLQTIDIEHQLAREGRLAEGGEFAGPQLVPADYSLTPHLVFANDKAGRLSWAGMLVGGLLSPVIGPAGMLAAGVNRDRSEAQVVMFLTDNRSGIQLAAAEGSATTFDWSFLGFGDGEDGAMGAGGWANTAKGKIVAGALLDGLNKIVHIVRDQTP